MDIIREVELKQIKGGFSSKALWVGLASFITFIIGAIDGYLRPLSCNK